MKKILIIGATSGMAEATARIWADQGHMLYLVARHSEKLKAVADDLIVRGGGVVFTHVMDANDLDAHEIMLNEVYLAMGGVDTVLIAHGTLSDQMACSNSVELTLNEINTNALSVIALLTLIANRFEQKNNGLIAVISSVAGDRGRKSNYVYGAAKGLVNRFVQGLQHRFAKSKVNVVLLKPGPTETAMTQHLKSSGGLSLCPVGIVAEQIVTAIDNKRLVAYIPGKWRYIMLVIMHMPFFIFKRLNI